MSIWVIEDDKVDVLSYKRGFSYVKEDFRIRYFTSALDVLKLMDGDFEIPRMIFLDLNLPKTNGIDFIKNVRSQKMDRHIPIVVVSTSTNQDDVAQVYVAGATAYFAKPIDLFEFKALIKNVVDLFRNPLLRL